MNKDIERIKAQIHDLYKQIERLEDKEFSPDWSVTSKNIREDIQRAFPHFKENSEEAECEPFYIDYVHSNDYLTETITAWADGTYEYCLGTIDDPDTDIIYEETEISLNQLHNIINESTIPLKMHTVKVSKFITFDLGLEYCNNEPDLFDIVDTKMSSKEIMELNERVYI